MSRLGASGNFCGNLPSPYVFRRHISRRRRNLNAFAENKRPPHYASHKNTNCPQRSALKFRTICIRMTVISHHSTFLCISTFLKHIHKWYILNFQKGTKAPQAAGRIHTDFEKGFIMAEVMKFADFKEEGSEAACKAAGKYRQQGRNYVVEDGDIIFFKFNAGAGLKDAKKKWLTLSVTLCVMVYLYVNMIFFYTSLNCWSNCFAFNLMIN